MAGVLYFVVCFVGYLYICQGVGTELANKTKEVNTEVTNQLEFVTQQLAKMDAKMSVLTWTNSQLQQQNDVLKVQVSMMNETNQQLLHDMEQRMTALQRQVTQLKDDKPLLTDKLNLQNSFISFSAYATQTRDYVEGDTVLFDVVINNYGGHYDPGTSVFTCPYTGFYMFAISIITTDAVMYAAIAVDGTIMFWAKSMSVGSPDDAQASNFIVILCDQGSQVSVVCPDGSANTMYGSTTHRYSTFVGTLLQHLVPVE